MLDIKALKTTIRASDSRDDRAFESNTFICDIKNSGSSGVIPDLLFSSEVYPIDCSLVTTKSLKSKTWLCFLCSCWWWGRTKCSWWWFRPKNWVKWYEARLRSKFHILTFPDHPCRPGQIISRHIRTFFHLNFVPERCAQTVQCTMAPLSTRMLL